MPPLALAGLVEVLLVRLQDRLARTAILGDVAQALAGVLPTPRWLVPEGLEDFPAVAAVAAAHPLPVKQRERAVLVEMGL